MYYYAYINESKIATRVYEMPVKMSEEQGFIEITQEVYKASQEGTEGSIIGMRWNATKRIWEEVAKYYYAVVIEKKFRKEVTAEDVVRYFVKGVMESDEKINDPLYIEIDGLESARVGQLYNPDTAGFTNAEFVEEAFTDTDYISVNGKNEVLTDKLEKMQEAIENIHIPEVTAESIKEKLKDVDGQGSGIDADLLDGKEATYFAADESVKALEAKVEGVKGQVDNIKIPEVTASTILEKLKTVDGASSGMDADLLDGKDSTYFATTAGLQNLTTVVNGKAPASHTHSNYALTSHEHVAKGCAVVSGEKWLEIESGKDSGVEELSMKVVSEVGGWSVATSKLIVPKAGKYLVMISGEAYISSGSIGRVGVYTNVINNTRATSTVLGTAIIQSQQFIPGSSQRISTKGDFAIVDANKGDQISIQHKMKILDGSAPCTVIVRPQIMLKEL